MGNDTNVLLGVAEDIKNYLSGVEGIEDVQDNVSEGNSGGSVSFVLDNTNKNSQNAFMLYAFLNGRLAENELGNFEFDEQTFEMISIVEPKISSEQEVLSIDVPTTEKMIYQQTMTKMAMQGISNPELLPEKPEDVTVGDLLESKEISESITIRRVNGKRFMEVYASVSEDGDAMKIQSDLEDYLSEDKLKELGLSEDALDYQGEVDSITQSFTDLLISLVVAIFMIYVLLVGFFRSFLKPFIILFAIPLGMIGVFFAIWLTTGQLGFLELLGVVTMAGIVVNVTILLIDYANQLKAEGKTSAEAISTSVAVRFRPIMLTQLTAFGSLAPLMFLSPFWKGLSASIIFGILSSAVLSLFLTPILYEWVESSATFFGKVYARIRKKLHR
jgi:multidrug efflux pump subunit AcrB